MKASKSISEWKRLAWYCEFGAFLNDAIRDRLVAGLRNQQTQRSLFAIEDLTFDNACKLALHMELAAKHTAPLHAPDAHNTEINAATLTYCKRPPRAHVPQPSRRAFHDQKAMMVGYRCGKRNDASRCRYKGYRCHNCSQVGHLKHMCRASEVQSTAFVEPSDEESENGVFYSVFSDSAATHAYTQYVMVGGQPIRMLVNTGVAASVNPERLYKK